LQLPADAVRFYDDPGEVGSAEVIDMIDRLTELGVHDTPSIELPTLTLRTAPNWTALFFFAALASIHWAIAVPAFYRQRWEGIYSLAFAALFTAVASACWLVASELSIQPARRQIRVRSGLGRFSIERSIPFAEVHGVRVIHSASRSALACRVEVLCDNEDLECPPTDRPHQQALVMAMMMDVQLIKVFPNDNAPQRAHA
jgi:hypothetical protein